jgi:hypothetical protein
MLSPQLRRKVHDLCSFSSSSSEARGLIDRVHFLMEGQSLIL